MPTAGGAPLIYIKLPPPLQRVYDGGCYLAVCAPHAAAHSLSTSRGVHHAILPAQRAQSSPRSRRTRSTARILRTTRCQCSDTNHDCTSIASRSDWVFVRCGRRYPTDDVLTVERG